MSVDVVNTNTVPSAPRVTSHIKIERACAVRVVAFSGRGLGRYVTVEFSVGNDEPTLVNLRRDDTLLANLDLDITNDV